MITFNIFIHWFFIILLKQQHKRSIWIFLKSQFIILLIDINIFIFLVVKIIKIFYGKFFIKFLKRFLKRSQTLILMRLIHWLLLNYFIILQWRFKFVSLIGIKFSFKKHWLRLKSVYEYFTAQLWSSLEFLRLVKNWKLRLGFCFW